MGENRGKLPRREGEGIAAQPYHRLANTLGVRPRGNMLRESNDWKTQKQRKNVQSEKINFNPAREYGIAQIAALTVHFVVTFFSLPPSNFLLLYRALYIHTSYEQVEFL